MFWHGVLRRGVKYVKFMAWLLDGLRHGCQVMNIP